jgi:hypothetical protein
MEKIRIRNTELHFQVFLQVILAKHAGIAGPGLSHHHLFFHLQKEQEKEQ